MCACFLGISFHRNTNRNRRKKSGPCGKERALDFGFIDEITSSLKLFFSSYKTCWPRFQNEWSWKQNKAEQNNALAQACFFLEDSLSSIYGHSAFTFPCGHSELTLPHSLTCLSLFFGVVGMAIIFSSEVCVFQSDKAKQPSAPISFLCVGRVVMHVATTFGNVTVFILFHLRLLLPKVGALSLGGLVPAKSHIQWHTLVCHLRTLICIYKLHSWKINLIDFLFSKCLCQNEHKVLPHLPDP